MVNMILLPRPRISFYQKISLQYKARYKRLFTQRDYITVISLCTAVPFYLTHVKTNKDDIFQSRTECILKLEF